MTGASESANLTDMTQVMRKRVAKQLKSYQEEQGLTQAEVALELAAHSHSKISRITIGRVMSVQVVGIKNFHRVRVFLREKGVK